MKINISNKTPAEIQELAKLYPEGFIQAIKGSVFWVFERSKILS